MSSRNQRGNRQESNFSRREHNESPNQWNAYSRSDSERSDRGSYRADQSNWTNRDYDRSEGREARTRDTGNRGFSEYSENQDRYGSTMRGDERQHEMNPYPHANGDYDSRRDMENRRFGAHEGNSYLNDRSHEDSGDRADLFYGSQNSFSGRGPKGFKRSDERIKEEVCEMLTRDHSIDAEDIDVEVKEGEVTLTGSVPDRRMKHLAEDCVERALGVKDVINNIRVKRDTASDTSSSSITGDRTSSGKKSAVGSTSTTGNPNH